MASGRSSPSSPLVEKAVASGSGPTQPPAATPPCRSTTAPSSHSTIDEPKVSWTKPASVIVAGLLVPTVMVALKGVPEPLRSSRVVNAVFMLANVRTRPTLPP
uniref:Uncharacterized protein n=1 Tax=Oryza brachyantha TaxID=4533 RepID=J3N334_ORYBR